MCCSMLGQIDFFPLFSEEIGCDGEACCREWTFVRGTSRCLDNSGILSDAKLSAARSRDTGAGGGTRFYYS